MPARARARRSPQHPDRGGVAPTPPPCPGIRARSRAPPAHARHRHGHLLRDAPPRGPCARAPAPASTWPPSAAAHMGCPSAPPVAALPLPPSNSNSNPPPCGGGPDHSARSQSHCTIIGCGGAPASACPIHHALPLHNCCRFWGLTHLAPVLVEGTCWRSTCADGGPWVPCPGPGSIRLSEQPMRCERAPRRVPTLCLKRQRAATYTNPDRKRQGKTGRRKSDRDAGIKTEHPQILLFLHSLGLFFCLLSLSDVQLSSLRCLRSLAGGESYRQSASPPRLFPPTRVSRDLERRPGSKLTERDIIQTKIVLGCVFVQRKSRPKRPMYTDICMYSKSGRVNNIPEISPNLSSTWCQSLGDGDGDRIRWSRERRLVLRRESGRVLSGGDGAAADS